MKKTKSAITLLLTLLLTLTFLPAINTQAAVKSTVINGVTYTMNYEDKFTATLSEDVTPQKEIHVLSKIPFNGKTYAVSEFYFGTINYYEDDLAEMNYKDPCYKIKPGSWQDVLQKITLDSGIEDIDMVCINYPNLEEVSFDTKFGPTFYNCPKLKHIYTGKNNLKGCFVQRCPNAKIIVDSANPYYKVIGKDIYSKDGKTLYRVSSTKSKYRVRKGVTKIEMNAFARNDYIKSIILPDTVKKVDPEAFSMMKNLSYVRISRSMKEIPYDLFVRSKKLKTITYPANIKKINGNFEEPYLYGLRKMYINTKSLKASDMKGISKKCRIYVKNKSVKNRVRKNGFKGKIIIKK